ncbi:hypothetical protein NHQ30_002374 [Ciborinia camelliae]|nr:hypothetical protein NHQ30_002374 [Ciborinia camelliae]
MQRAFPLPVNVGTDICQISRIGDILTKQQSKYAHRFIRRLLTPQEQVWYRPRLLPLIEYLHFMERREFSQVKNEKRKRKEAKGLEALIGLAAPKEIPLLSQTAASSEPVGTLIWSPYTQDCPKRLTIVEEEAILNHLRKKVPGVARFLAGRFAAKEAAKKAFSKRKLGFHDITIDNPSMDNLRSTAPITLIRSDNGREDQIVPMSISHDGDYATAVCMSCEDIAPPPQLDFQDIEPLLARLLDEMTIKRLSLHAFVRSSYADTYQRRRTPAKSLERFTTPLQKIPVKSTTPITGRLSEIFNPIPGGGSNVPTAEIKSGLGVSEASNIVQPKVSSSLITGRLSEILNPIPGGVSNVPTAEIKSGLGVSEASNIVQPEVSSSPINNPAIEINPNVSRVSNPTQPETSLLFPDRPKIKYHIDAASNYNNADLLNKSFERILERIQPEVSSSPINNPAIEINPNVSRVSNPTQPETSLPSPGRPRIKYHISEKFKRTLERIQPEVSSSPINDPAIEINPNVSRVSNPTQPETSLPSPDCPRIKYHISEKFKRTLERIQPEVSSSPINNPAIEINPNVSRVSNPTQPETSLPSPGRPRIKYHISAASNYINGELLNENFNNGELVNENFKRILERIQPEDYHSRGFQGTGYQPTDSQPTNSQSTDNQSTDNQSTDNQLTNNQSIDNQPTDSQSTNNQPTDSQPTDNQPTDSQPTDSQPTNNQPTDNQPTDSQPTDSQPTDSQPTDSQPTDSQPTGDQVKDYPSMYHSKIAREYSSRSLPRIDNRSTSDAQNIKETAQPSKDGCQPGDWICAEGGCGFQNIVRNYKCVSCGTDRLKGWVNYVDLDSSHNKQLAEFANYTGLPFDIGSAKEAEKKERIENRKAVLQTRNQSIYGLPTYLDPKLIKKNVENCLRIKGLPFDTTKEDLLEAFKGKCTAFKAYVNLTPEGQIHASIILSRHTEANKLRHQSKKPELLPVIRGRRLEMIKMDDWLRELLREYGSGARTWNWIADFWTTDVFHAYNSTECDQNAQQQQKRWEAIILEKEKIELQKEERRKKKLAKQEEKRRKKYEKGEREKGGSGRPRSIE